MRKLRGASVSPSVEWELDHRVLVRSSHRGEVLAAPAPPLWGSPPHPHAPWKSKAQQALEGKAVAPCGHEAAGPRGRAGPHSSLFPPGLLPRRQSTKAASANFTRARN